MYLPEYLPSQPPQSEQRSPRIEVESLCAELQDSVDRYSIVTDISAEGLRLQRPLGGLRTRHLQLEFEIPGVDELIWAQGEICFDQLWSTRHRPSGLGGALRTSGVRITRAADRHMRIMREFVMDQWLVNRLPVQEQFDWQMRSHSFMRA